MRNTLKWTIPFVIAAVVAIAAPAQERGTPAEAKQMVEEGLAHVKAVGPVKAFEDFNAPGGKWHKKDIYLFCYNFTGTCMCQGAINAQVGKEMINFRTADGQLFVQNLIALSKTKGSGWIEYFWPHPQTKKMEAKQAWIARIPGQDLLIGAGAYK
jgi:cytochrome c